MKNKSRNKSKKERWLKNRKERWLAAGISLNAELTILGRSLPRKKKKALKKRINKDLYLNMLLEHLGLIKEKED